MLGEQNSTINRFEFLLSILSELSAPRLRIDPDWVKHPGYQKLIAGEKRSVL